MRRLAAGIVSKFATNDTESISAWPLGGGQERGGLPRFRSVSIIARYASAESVISSRRREKSGEAVACVPFACSA
jgi:hypothetical protein